MFYLHRHRYNMLREVCVGVKRGHPEWQRWRNKTALGARGVPRLREASFLLFRTSKYARFPVHLVIRCSLSPWELARAKRTEQNGSGGGRPYVIIAYYILSSRYSSIRVHGYNMILSGWPLVTTHKSQHCIIIIIIIIII